MAMRPMNLLNQTPFERLPAAIRELAGKEFQ